MAGSYQVCAEWSEWGERDRREGARVALTERAAGESNSARYNADRDPRKASPPGQSRARALGERTRQGALRNTIVTIALFSCGEKRVMLAEIILLR